MSGTVNTTGNHSPAYLTADEVADLLRTTRKAVYARLARGQLPAARRVGRRVIWNRAVLIEWLESLSTCVDDGGSP